MALQVPAPFRIRVSTVPAHKQRLDRLKRFLNQKVSSKNVHLLGRFELISLDRLVGLVGSLLSDNEFQFDGDLSSKEFLAESAREFQEASTRRNGYYPLDSL